MTPTRDPPQLPEFPMKVRCLFEPDAQQTQIVRKHPEIASIHVCSLTKAGLRRRYHLTKSGGGRR
jgi:hypothetical protein